MYSNSLIGNTTKFIICKFIKIFNDKQNNVLNTCKIKLNFLFGNYNFTQL